jgi:hypothetical protein
MGHNVRNVIDGRHRVTKQPLNLFFVDLEPAGNNKEFYNTDMLQNKTFAVGVQEYRFSTMLQMSAVWTYQDILQLTFCLRKCGGSHNTASCKKPSNTPAKRALCDGPHLVNYKGCEFYHSLIKPNNTNNSLNVHRNPMVNMANFNSPVRPELPKPTTKNTYRNASYADVTRGVINNSRQEEDTSTLTLNRFLEGFKNMFVQLIQQNTMILNMLSTLLTKFHNG